MVARARRCKGVAHHPGITLIPAHQLLPDVKGCQRSQGAPQGVACNMQTAQSKSYPAQTPSAQVTDQVNSMILAVCTIPLPEVCAEHAIALCLQQLPANIRSTHVLVLSDGHVTTTINQYVNSPCQHKADRHVDPSAQF